MDDPTGELRRQRELVAAHLRWLDDQIARASGQQTKPPATEEAATPDPSAPVEEVAIVLPEIDPGSVRSEVRRGCFIYVIGVTLLLAAGLAVAVWVARNYGP